MKEIRTKLGQLHLYDLVKAAFLAAIAAPVETLYDIVDKGVLPEAFDWKGMLKASIIVFVGYIIKQLSTGEGGKILTNKKPNMKFAFPVNSYQDLVGTTGLTVIQFCAANISYTMQDGPEQPNGEPNMVITTNLPPAPFQMIDAATNAPYTCNPVMCDSNGIPPHR